jgi:integrase
VQSEPHKSTILDGKVHIYSRPNSAFFWCGFHHRGKYLRASTKKTDLSEAEAVARDWFYDRQADIRRGALKVGGVTFRKASEHTLATYEQLVAVGERSEDYLLGIKKVLKSRVVPFFGDIPVTQIDTTTWAAFKKHVYASHPKASARATLHQYKNAVRIVLNEAHKSGWLPQLPVFKDDYSSKKQTKPRTWFEVKEYAQLYKATRDNIKVLKDTRWAEAAEELHDYVIFVANTGLRVGEAMNLRFCDVEVIQTLDETNKKREVLLLKNIKGKRGTGECKSYYGAVRAFRRIEKRRKPKAPTDKLFVEYHRSMFNTVLDRIGLKCSDGQPPARRDLMSLRHTYVCFRILGGANVFDIAANCRTSVQMIEEHYAQRLRPRMSTTINRSLAAAGFGKEMV